MEGSGFLELPELSVGAARGAQQSQIQPKGVSVHGGGKLDPRSLILLTFFTNIIAINSSATWLILLCIITTALFSLCALPWRFFMGWAGFEFLCVICAFVPPVIAPSHVSVAAGVSAFWFMKFNITAAFGIMFLLPSPRTRYRLFLPVCVFPYLFTCRLWSCTGSSP